MNMVISKVFWRTVNMFRGEQTRAASQHTSLRGLRRLSYNEGQEQKEMIAGNLARRMLAGPEITKKALARFAPDVLLGALKRVVNTAGLTPAAKVLLEAVPGFLCGDAYAMVVPKLSERNEVLSVVGKFEERGGFYSHNLYNAVLAHPETNKGTLISIAEITTDSIFGAKAYERIDKAALSPEEWERLVACNNEGTLNRIKRDAGAPPATVEKATSRCKELQEIRFAREREIADKLRLPPLIEGIGF